MPPEERVRLHRDEAGIGSDGVSDVIPSGVEGVVNGHPVGLRPEDEALDRSCLDDAKGPSHGALATA